MHDWNSSWNEFLALLQRDHFNFILVDCLHAVCPKVWPMKRHADSSCVHRWVFLLCAPCQGKGGQKYSSPGKTWTENQEKNKWGPNAPADGCSWSLFPGSWSSWSCEWDNLCRTLGQVLPGTALGIMERIQQSAFHSPKVFSLFLSVKVTRWPCKFEFSEFYTA